MSREYLVTISCDHPCYDFDNCSECLSEVKWEPDGVNVTAEGWHVDYEATAHDDDAEPLDYCDPCWQRIQSEAITPHKKGE